MSKNDGKYLQCMTYTLKEYTVTNIHSISQKAQYSVALPGPRHEHISLDRTMVQPELGMIHQPHQQKKNYKSTSSSARWKLLSRTGKLL
jgi:hypothetical protein